MSPPDPDRRIQEVLGAEEADQLGPLGEPPLMEQVAGVFRGRLRWVNLLTVVFSLAFAIFAIISVISFFRAESIREMIAWAGGFGLSLIVITTGRLWLWDQLHTNAVLREVKRLELQVARLASRLRGPA
jgi:uncharacterized membrane protein YciS (DUF1049 family)